MLIVLIVLGGLTLWIGLALAVAQWCSVNTRSEEADRRAIDLAVSELRSDMTGW